MTASVQEWFASPYLTVAEVAHVLSISRRTVRRMIDARQIDAVRLGPAQRAHLRISPAALRRFVDGAAFHRDMDRGVLAVDAAATAPK